VGAVKFVTIDVGGDDVNGCAPNGVVNNTCVQKGLQAVATNMQTILAGLRAAGGNVPIVGMVYYDPVGLLPQRSEWPTDGHGVTRAPSPAQLGTPRHLQAVSSPDRPRAKGFDTWDMALTVSFNGQTLPQDVANICNWTHMCDPTNPKNHTNDTGHAELATAFETRLKLVRCHNVF
jgi:hypothetical protein